MLIYLTYGIEIDENLHQHNLSASTASGTETTLMLYQYLRPIINYGCGILWVCFITSMRSMQHGLITELLRTYDCCGDQDI